jgi:hypothetical protein
MQLLQPKACGWRAGSPMKDMRPSWFRSAARRMAEVTVRSASGSAPAAESQDDCVMYCGRYDAHHICVSVSSVAQYIADEPGRLRVFG